VVGARSSALLNHPNKLAKADHVVPADVMDFAVIRAQPPRGRLLEDIEQLVVLFVLAPSKHGIDMVVGAQFEERRADVVAVTRANTSVGSPPFQHFVELRPGLIRENRTNDLVPD
jgi:hypothetical protein